MINSKNIQQSEHSQNTYDMIPLPNYRVHIPQSTLVTHVPKMYSCHREVGFVAYIKYFKNKTGQCN